MKTFNIILIIIILLLLLFLLILSIVNVVFNHFFKGRSDGDIRYKFFSVRDYPNLKQEFVTTLNRKNNRLNGSIFYYQNKEYKGTIIFFHGLYTGYITYLNLIEYYCRHNYKVIAFDFTGSMSSAGVSIRGMANSEIDADAIIKFTLNDSRLNKLPLYVIGHSWGAHTALTSALHNDKDIKKIIAFAPFNSHVDCCYSIVPFTIILSPFIYLYNLFRFGHESTYKAIDAMNYCDVDMLIYSGGVDEIVKPQYSYVKFKKNLHEGITLKYLKDANHFLYMDKEAAKHFNKVASFTRNNPIDFDKIDYKLLAKLDEDLLKETLEFLEK